MSFRNGYQQDSIVLEEVRHSINLNYNIIELKREKFCEEKIKKLKKHIEFYHSKGQSIDYEIVVDNLKSVRRTSDPSHFDNYKHFLDKYTRDIMIRLFTGKSNKATKSFSIGKIQR